ncbi:MAG: BrnA antitoxin family protein [Vicinamibacterales bacterium]
MRKNPSRPDEENPEWTAEDFRRARPALEALPKEVVEAIRRYRGQRGPQKAPTKELISIRVDRDVAEALRATGSGWQTRANEALRAYTKRTGLRRASSTKRAKAKRKTPAAPKHP